MFLRALRVFGCLERVGFKVYAGLRGFLRWLALPWRAGGGALNASGTVIMGSFREGAQDSGFRV